MRAVVIDKPNDIDFAAQTRWRIQPAKGFRGRKLWSQVIQPLGAEQSTAGANSKLDKSSGQGSLISQHNGLYVTLFPAGLRN
jgi:hypothetical protein